MRLAAIQRSQVGLATEHRPRFVHASCKAARADPMPRCEAPCGCHAACRATLTHVTCPVMSCPVTSCLLHRLLPSAGTPLERHTPPPLGGKLATRHSSPGLCPLQRLFLAQLLPPGQLSAITLQHTCLPQGPSSSTALWETAGRDSPQLRLAACWQFPAWQVPAPSGTASWAHPPGAARGAASLQSPAWGCGQGWRSYLATRRRIPAGPRRSM